MPSRNSNRRPSYQERNAERLAIEQLAHRCGVRTKRMCGPNGREFVGFGMIPEDQIETFVDGMAKITGLDPETVMDNLAEETK